jgi:hypothetical protein
MFQLISKLNIIRVGREMWRWGLAVTSGNDSAEKDGSLW